MFGATAIRKKLNNAEHVFMLTMFVVNAGNYAYNLILGRFLGPKAFADAALLITFLLVLSFVGMTFQILTTRYTILLTGNLKDKFIKTTARIALGSGAVVGFIFIAFSKQLQNLLHTETHTMFYLFGVGIPLYFLMSVNRGVYQGDNKLKQLSTTYLTEMLSRLIITIILLLFATQLSTTILVATGIALSFVFGLIPFQKALITASNAVENVKLDAKPIVLFFALTAFYELTQIIINNSDVLLVKHYFDNQQAGFYAALALIGRVVYFVTWLFVMLLLPKVIRLHKEGKNTQPILMKYITIIGLFSAAIVIVAYFFPETVVYLMFGNAYLSIAPLLWQYALATAIFAIANVFSYYFLSMNNYIPVVISAVLGGTQIGLIVLFHESLEQVVQMQIIAMLILLVFQLCYFFYQHKKSIGRL